jgi:hypothetical protein
VLVFCPVDMATFDLLRQGQTASRLPAWRADLASGADPEADEEAEYLALTRASSEGLARHGLRLVVVADVAPAAWQDDPASVGGRGWLRLASGRLTAFFVDDPAEADQLQRLARDLASGPPATAWATPAGAVLAELRPLWYDVSEMELPLELPAIDGLRRLPGPEPERLVDPPATG